MNFTKKMNSKVLMSNIMLNYLKKKKQNRKQDSIPMGNESMLKKMLKKKKNQNCNLVLKNELKKY